MSPRTGDFNYKELELIPASLDDYPIIQNLTRFYLYDMSEYFPDEEMWAMPSDGLYECLDCLFVMAI